jgi:hypothetical protein
MCSCESVIVAAGMVVNASRVMGNRGRRALGTDRCVVATVANDAFTEYALVLLGSIRRRNSWFAGLPLRVFWSPHLAPLSPGNQKRLRQAHPGTTFVSVDGAAYERYRPETPPRLMAALLKLEAFGIRDADRVVFLDADMACLGDLTDLFTLDVDLAACPTGSNRAAKEACAGTIRRRLRINTGVLVIGRRYLNDATQRRLGRYPSGQFADQDVVNGFLRGRSVYCLDHRFNYHAEFFWRGDETDVRLLHYAGTKPLDVPDLARMRPWFAARERQRRGP